jgi:hypothetical protein
MSEFSDWINEQLKIGYHAHMDHAFWCGESVPLHLCVREKHVYAAVAFVRRGEVTAPQHTKIVGFLQP